MKTLENILPNLLKSEIQKLPNEYIIKILEEAVKQYEIAQQESQIENDPDKDFVKCAQEAFASVEAKNIFKKFSRFYNSNRTFNNTIKI